MIWMIAGLILLTIVGCAIVIVSIDNYQFKLNNRLIEKLQADNASGNTLVVFFSRSGNTELMARKIAEIKRAHVIPIQSERNKIGFKGWIEALQDARKTVAEISSLAMDLSKYDTIYIGSLIWLYSPRPQVFEFAKQNDFTEKKVILFNSINSKFEQQYVDDFKTIIEQNGGIFEKHIYVVRGRMTQQMDTYSFLKEVEEVVK